MSISKTETHLNLNGVVKRIDNDVTLWALIVYSTLTEIPRDKIDF